MIACFDCEFFNSTRHRQRCMKWQKRSHTAKCCLNECRWLGISFKLRHILLGKYIEGIFCSLKCWKSFVQFRLYNGSNLVCLVSLFANFLSFSIHLQVPLGLGAQITFDTNVLDCDRTGSVSIQIPPPNVHGLCFRILSIQSQESTIHHGIRHTLKFMVK